jgi:4-hydroxybenzoate polyprenyltransferase
MLEGTGTPRSDIPVGSWVDRLAPAASRPYLRLARIDRPIGVWLLLLPCWWGTALAGPGWPDPWLLALFAVGAIVMRGAGCTFNDIVDRDFDRRVARTAGRPIPSGQVSIAQAALFMIALSLIGLAVLLQLDPPAIALGIASLALVASYPFMKRITYWPQAFLGLTFNWGVLVASAATVGAVTPAAIALYAAGVFWTLGYDTIYAHQDKEDDALIGVKSTALALGSGSRRWLFAFYAATLLLVALAAYLANLGPAAIPFFLAVGGHLAWQAASVDFDNPSDCLAKFKANRDTGLIIFAGIVAGHVLS